MKIFHTEELNIELHRLVLSLLLYKIYTKHKNANAASKKRYINTLIIIHIPKTSEYPYCNKKKLICFVQYFCNRNKKGIPQNGTPSA
ncbi:MAG: hypothetical protein D3905_14400 [Candidatus Electrothrix sp. AS4_5]|nr:hypothetical protein [Candidatus Electrothrix gigas]